jgi:Cysteine-rich secretory protein family
MVLVTKVKPKSSLSHKKRIGAHHRRSGHYAKPYFPYLPLFLMFFIGILLNSFWIHTNPQVLGDNTNISVTNLLHDTNNDRLNSNEKILILDSQLMTAAQSKANDMVANNYWSHNAPDGKTPWNFMSSAGYQFSQAGENLAYGFSSASQALKAWMNSPEHRANILNPDYSQVGFGIAVSGNYLHSGPQIIVVAMYGDPLTKSGLNVIPGHSNNQSAVLGDFASTQSQSVTGQRVSRVQIITGFNRSFIVVMVLLVSAGVVIVYRHTLMWRRVIVNGEKFVANHFLLDLAVVSIFVLGFLLTRTAGFIH